MFSYEPVGEGDLVNRATFALLSGSTAFALREAIAEGRVRAVRRDGRVYLRFPAIDWNMWISKQ